MNRLPFETLLAICGCIEQRYLCDFRLVCKAFAAAGESDLVSQLYLIGCRSSFENVLRISRQPNLNHYVNGITYNSVSREPLRPAQLVGHTGPGDIEDSCMGTPYNNDGPQKTLDFRDSNEYYSCIASAVARFPNLREIKLLDPSPGQEHSSVLEYTNSINDVFDTSKLLHCFLYAVVGANVPVQQLVVEGLEWDFWNIRSASLTSRSLTHLKELKVVIEGGFSNEYSLHEQKQMLTAFGIALNSLTTAFNYNDIMEYIDCHEIMPALYWPNLKSLRLRHSNLMHLILSWAQLDQGNWDSITARLDSLSNVGVKYPNMKNENGFVL
ncbi:hypothetical protein B0J14DRAFT_677165 [Halenospora varia]|nr:hypothetical protein B0J14DRAFT_677165 [Halenospora varia]